MNHRIQWVLLLLLGFTLKLAAQGTAFNYQGRLSDSGAPANAAYDFRFALYDAVTNGNQVSVPLTNSAVAVSNGLFSVTLDFGAGLFTGTNYWLDIGVRAVGVTNFTPLLPRQPVLPVPYAIFATGASNLLGTLPAAQLTGILSASQVAGTSANQVNFLNANNTFSGTFSGNGGPLTNLNGSQITFGIVADARLSTNVALLNGSQTFSGNNQFYGANNFTNFANSFSGSFFGNGLVGWITVAGTAQAAIRDHGYMLTNAGLTTVTLPATGLSAGDIVRISGAGAGGWLVAENPGQIILGNFASYLNTYYIEAPTNADYSDIAASADGSQMYVVGNSVIGVSASSDSGHTWNRVGSTYISGTYRSIACSANGKVVYAEPGTGGTIKISTNSGVTWTNSSFSATNTAIACSADGSKVFTGNIACSGNGTYLAKISAGIAISTNGGSAWFNIPAPLFGTPTCLAASSDCTKLVAGVSNGLLYASANLGASWTPVTVTNQFWSGVWLSPDGSKFAGTVNTSGIMGGIYNYGVSVLPNVVSTNSAIGGSQGSAVELQYIGNNQFMPVSSTGLLWAN